MQKQARVLGLQQALDSAFLAVLIVMYGGCNRQA